MHDKIGSLDSLQPRPEASATFASDVQGGWCFTFDFEVVVLDQ